MNEKTRYDALIHEICVKYGFCGCVKNGKGLHVDDLIPSHGPVTADQFVEWVFLADDMNPNVDLERWAPLKQKIKAAFVEHVGGDVIDAALLRSS